jgi:hypothetical protein
MPDGPLGTLLTLAYEADFSFGTAYQYYAFGPSTVAIDQANEDQELSAVGTAVPELRTAAVPEPMSLVLLAGGVLALGAFRRSR